MGFVLHKELDLEDPVLVCSWSGIGNIGLVAVDNLQYQVSAQEIGLINPWHFFDPRNAVVKNGFIESLEFPKSKFYYQNLTNKDSVFFVGEEQPGQMGKMHGGGEKAYHMAGLVLEAAEKLGIKKIYTSGACVAAVHHQVKPRVVAVASSEKLLQEVKMIPNVYSMGETSEEGGEGVITGLNGLLLAMAQKRGLETACLMGEIPDWLSRAPFPYPRASQSVMEAFAHVLGIDLDFTFFEKKTEDIDKVIEKLYHKFPEKVKEQYDERKTELQPGPITHEEAEWMKAHLDDFLKNLPKSEGEDDNDDDQKPT